MNKIALFICLLFSLSIAIADIYKWTDKNGQVHFGDAAHTTEKTESIDLSHINSYNAPSKNFIDTILARPTSIQNKKSAKVTIYSAVWCGVCRTAKKWFVANKIKFREYDIETSKKGRRDYKKLKGNGVPIIMVGQQRMNGFNPSRMKKMLKNAKR